MTGSKEIFLDEQERNYSPEDQMLYEMQQQEQALYDELPPAGPAGPLPILDLNTLAPADGVIKLDKDTLNVRSSDIALAIIAAVNDGLIDPLELLVKKKLVVDALEMAAKDPTVKAAAVEAVQAYGKDGATKLGAKLTITGRAAYQYNQDPTWAAIKEEMKPLEERLKAQEEKIKAACKNNCSLVGEGGELIASVVPAPVTESVSVSFSKKK